MVQHTHTPYTYACSCTLFICFNFYFSFVFIQAGYDCGELLEVGFLQLDALQVATITCFSSKEICFFLRNLKSPEPSG